MTAAKPGYPSPAFPLSRSPILSTPAAAAQLAAALALAPEVHPFDLEPVESFPHEFPLVVEIPDGAGGEDARPIGVPAKDVDASLAVVERLEDPGAPERYNRERSRTQ